MTNLEMFYFAGKFLSIDEHAEFREVIIKMISDDELDWSHFVSLCSNHLILPVIYLKIKSHNLIEHLPEELAEFLKEIYDLNLARNEQILLQINDILRLLNAKDIYPTFLKGTGNLLDGLYSDKGERMIGDIDFLVPEKDYLKAAKILEDDGYSRNPEFYGDFLIEKHYPALFKPDVPAQVEVHRQIVPKKYCNKFDQGVINLKKIFTGEDSVCFVLSDKDKAIHNFIHCQLSNRGNLYGIVPFRDIYDLYKVSKRIEISSIINLIHYKRKAITYFVFAGKAINLPTYFYKDENIYSKIFILRHSLNYSSLVFYRTNRIIGLIYKRILQSLTFFYSRQERQFLINMLILKKTYAAKLIPKKLYFRPKL